MKLAEALSLRADLQKRIAQLKERTGNNVKVQEGDKPAEDPAALLKEMDAALAKLETLIYRINATNLQTERDGENLTRMIARRDVLALKAKALRDVLAEATDRQDRYSRNEIRYVTTVDVAALQRQADACAKELRELDVKIQGINWNVELI